MDGFFGYNATPQVLMKPGKPLTFAKLPCPGRGPLLVFGLPGNPVSSIVTFHLFVNPCLRALHGCTVCGTLCLPCETSMHDAHQDPNLPRVHATTTKALRLDPQRPEYHRVALAWEDPLPECPTGRWLATSTGGQISSRLLSMRSATALLELPQQEGTLPAGSVVPALLIGAVGRVA